MDDDHCDCSTHLFIIQKTFSDTLFPIFISCVTFFSFFFRGYTCHTYYRHVRSLVDMIRRTKLSWSIQLPRYDVCIQYIFPWLMLKKLIDWKQNNVRVFAWWLSSFFFIQSCSHFHWNVNPMFIQICCVNLIILNS